MKKITCKMVSAVLAAAMSASVLTVSLTAVSADADKVKIVVRNDTYSKDKGAKWDGVLFESEVELGETTDALTVVTKAIREAGYDLTVNDTQWGSYIAAVNGVAENEAAQYSGWMGVQNDWVVNNNLAYIPLRDGDVFELTYSVSVGADIGADWNNPTTALKALAVDGAAHLVGQLQVSRGLLGAGGEQLIGYVGHHLAFVGDPADEHADQQQHGQKQRPPEAQREKPDADQQGDAHAQQHAFHRADLEILPYSLVRHFHFLLSC